MISDASLDKIYALHECLFEVRFNNGLILYVYT